jgi:hypothetical protein
MSVQGELLTQNGRREFEVGCSRNSYGGSKRPFELVSDLILFKSYRE